MDAWDEIRTAFHVARLGTVSGAAEALGVHHATVIRHIDALEGRLGAKLFQRHARGYTATEAGQDLLQVAQATDDQFTQLAGRLRGQGETVSGELVVTSLPSLSPLLAPVIAEFQRDHPGLITRFLTDNRVFRLEYGEAHVAIRAGSVPQEPDNVVQHFISQDVALFGTAEYLQKSPPPENDEDLLRHRFIGFDTPKPKAPYYKWMAETIPSDQVVFRATDARAVKYAILAGVGLGFVPTWEADQHPELIEVVPRRDEWSANLWLVTHVDLHRTAKVQAILTHLKAQASIWNGNTT
ncbi:MAG: LysR family transcriptional regulator [Mangrovicoccus sp.]